MIDAPPMFGTDAAAVDWMHSRMFRNFETFSIQADRLSYGDCVIIKHELRNGKYHHAHAPTLREALSYARRALHEWAPEHVAPERDFADDWPYPKTPGAVRGHPRVQLPEGT